MAIDPSAFYPGQIDTSDPAGYPHGKAQDLTAVGAGNGTPLEKNWVNDLFGFQQAALAGAGLTPSGTPDKVGASQYLSAISTVVATPINVDRAKQKQIAQAQNWPERSAVIGVTVALNANTPMGFLSSGGMKRFVAFDKSACRPYTSNDGTVWTQRASFGATNGIGAVASGVIGGNPALAAGEDITGNIWTSLDGAAWTNSGALPSIVAGAIVYAPSLGLWVAAAGLATGGAVYTSPDCATWTSRTVPGGWAGKIANRIVWNGSLFVITTSTSYGKVLTSPDGVTWTERTLPASTSWTGLAWSAVDGLWMVVNGGGVVCTSPDGITWTGAAPPGAHGLNDLAVNGSVWVGPVPSGNFGGLSWSSDKGATWQTICVGDHSTSLQGYSRILLADDRFILSRSSATSLEFALSQRAMV